MADMAVSFAREKLLPLIGDEANLLWNVSKEFKDIKDELVYLQGFLQEADERAGLEGDNRNKGIKKWLEQLREASFRIEDVTDEYMVYVEQQHHESGCASLLCEILHFIETLVPRHRIASEIQQIKFSLHGIRQRSADYQLKIQPSVEQGSSSYTNSQIVQWQDLRMDSPYPDEAVVVGIEGPRDELIGWLVKGQEERVVISVVGMGGLGKTTLVNKVFNNKEVIGAFDCRVWITVSQSYTVEGLMRDLLKKLCKPSPQDISTMDRKSLIDEVRKHLQQKRYVVVFDDVWHVQLWGQIKNAVYDNKKGSRILITTRKMDVVNSCNNSHFDRVHELKRLTPEKSLELFYKKAFQFDHNGCYPEHLKNISLDIVKRCNGLPLAIVAIGGLLSKKEKTTFEWEKINQRLASELDGVTKILGFSYDDLPYYLKSCLLHFGVYPEDFEIKSKRLIRQWIAEGFVREEVGRTLEEVAQQYLIELIGRSLVQVSSFTIDGRARSCHIHDLLREMLLKKFKDLSFCQHISNEDESTSNGMIRRLSLATISNDLMGSTESLHTRSLFVFTGKKSELTNNFVQRIPTEYRLLKVLDFEGGYLRYIPENWGNLTHLKYLSLRCTSVSALNLSKFIGKLQNLETLDIRDTDVKEMPKEICKLRKLRHLLGRYMTLFQLKNDLGGMTSLQTLSYIRLMDDGAVELIRELGKMKQLRNLGLIGVKEEQGSVLCSSLNAMKNLEKLHIESEWIGCEVIDLHDISSLRMLRKLWLCGKLNKLPEWVPQLQNLVKLTLMCSELTDDPLKSLQKMPHLLFLDLNLAYVGENLYFQDGGFQQLKELYLGDLYNLNAIIIDNGALHSLRKLQFLNIPKLKTVPLGIQHLEKLEVFEVSDMSTEFNQCIAPDEGPEHSIIQHVPLVRITNFPKTRVIHRPRH